MSMCRVESAPGRPALQRCESDTRFPCPQRGSIQEFAAHRHPARIGAAPKTPDRIDEGSDRVTSMG